ncbi:hypothetical protein M433DRAFT_157435 [Acidomyces richmondensis BFW]|nr:MAG: hypothetical protein FE78DRAFT_94810 [Acidomyces sp. 'richmondensis']KYG42823.1 hypothetical protein M433DRAFT_157435 [Acidomyces richmondensis BFW]
MAPVKRKAVTDERPSKKAKAGREDNASKQNKSKSLKSQNEDGERRPVAKSILHQEEHSFPRGGGSVLTPLEERQIKAQAERDVLFEHQTGQKASARDENGDLLYDEGTAVAAPAKKKRKANHRESGAEKTFEGSGMKIQSLSYKNLVVGSLVLGRVTAITNKDVALALSNNLTGYVPITSVSEVLNKRIEKLLAEDPRQAEGGEEEEKEEEGEGEGEEAEDIDLKKLFHIGQWLRAVVVASGGEVPDGGKSKRHIELSVDPQEVNAALDANAVVVNSMIQAAVRSVEDHGIVMDLGLSDKNTKGFISKKELGAGYDIEKIQRGQVILGLVTGKSSNGKVIKLSPDASKFSVSPGFEKNECGPVVSEAPTVDAFLPGTAVQLLILESGPNGVTGKIMGMVTVTADIIHSGAAEKNIDMAKKYKVGSKINGRIIWSLLSDGESKRIGVSLLEHLLVLPPPTSKLPDVASKKLRAKAAGFERQLPLSSFVEDAKVTLVLPERGLFMTLPTGSGEMRLAFSHISQISDKRIDVLTASSGAYQVGSTHKVRIISYNPMDNVYYVSLKKSILEQTYLRLEDLTIGEVVKGTVERLILGGKTGITGVLVKLSDHITGLVPEMHFSDAQLQHPERKFREGHAVTARVLSIDLDKRHLRLTLKKSIVNEEDESKIWKSYDCLRPSMESKGTIVNILPTGAVTQFYGNVRAWLSVGEMSEGYIERPEQHFRLGQTVNVRILSVDAAAQEMKVSCKAAGAFNEENLAAWEQLDCGAILNGTITEKGGENVSIDLANGLRGMIRVGHLADGPSMKADSALKRLRVGQDLNDLVVLHKMDRRRVVLLSNKPSLVNDAKDGSLIRSFSDIKEGRKVRGFVRNVTPEGVYVEFANSVVGMVPKSQIGSDMVGKPAFGLVKDQTVDVWILKIDFSKEKVTLSMRDQAPITKEDAGPANSVSLGQIVQVKIASVKSTQINVRFADGIHGRIDVSEVFDSWDQILNKKAPLQKFKPNDELEAKILGVHDARNHRFLPISHRQSKAPVFELSAKPSRTRNASEEMLSLDSVEVGREYLAFINNHGGDCVWVSLSPNVRGRVPLIGLSDDLGMLQNLKKNFPIGSALRVTVKNIDSTTDRLELTAKTTGQNQEALTLKDISPGMVLPARVTKVTEHAITVQLSESLAAPVPLVELNDDYEQANPTQYNKNDIVRVCVLDIDMPTNKLFLTLRPSKVLSSSLPIVDPHIVGFDQLKVGDILRGFVKHIIDTGVIVSLGARVDVFVRISGLSDKHTKDWKSLVRVGQLVKGRILSVDVEAKTAILSLKASHVEKEYIQPMNITDLEPGMVVTGKVRKVEDFGAFIDIDNTQPRLSGLCHRSEVASKRVEDVRQLYSVGDVVKAIILKVDVEARKISLSLKASNFAEDEDEEEDSSSEKDDGVKLNGGAGESGDIDDMDIDGGVDVKDIDDTGSEEDAQLRPDHKDADELYLASAPSGLKTAGFDWTGDAFGGVDNESDSDSDVDIDKKRKRKRHKSEIKVDMTGDLDKYGPRSVDDFERQLLGQPNDSGLWIQYMAFQLELSEVEKARDIAERALRTIHIRETEEKANIWIAWINLEVEYGDDDRVEDVFKQACQVQDSLEMHEKLASIYIDSGKHEKADKIFERIVGNKNFRASPEVWLNYATFLMNTLKEPARARPLLSRALQSVPTNEHRLLTAKFAALEFHSAEGDAERARTIFEGLVTEWPKWASGWDMWVDLERSRLAHIDAVEAKEEQKRKVRALFERMAAQKMKKRRAKFVFKRWLEFEENEGDGKSAERVKGLAKEWVQSQHAKDEEDAED